MAEEERQEDGEEEEMPMTTECLERIVKKEMLKSTFEGSALRGWKGTRVGEGQGFLSFLLRVELDWTDEIQEFYEGSTLPSTLVLKLLSGSLTPNAANQVNEAECSFYDLWKSHEQPLPVPKCYFSSPQENIIVLEDMGGVGVVPDYGTGLNLFQTLNVVKAVANLHAWSIKNKERWIKLTKRPTSSESDTSFTEMSLTKIRQLATNYPEYLNSRLLKPLEEYASTVKDALLQFGWDAPEKLGMRCVLVHGDLWISNLFFSKERAISGSSSSGVGNRLVALIDWQLFHPGVAGEDLCRLLVSSLPSALRRKELSSILRCYFRTFSDHFSDQPQDPFTLEQLTKSYHAFYSLSVFNAVLGVAMFLEAKTNPNPKTVQSLFQRLKHAIEDMPPTAEI